MPTDLTDALRALDRLDGVAEAVTAARSAAAELRWHEGMRRRWREARAETAVRTAVASAAVDGARVEVSWLRRQVAAGPDLTDPGSSPAAGPGEELVLAAWLAQVHADALLGELGGKVRAPDVPAAALVSGLHRDLTARLAARGRIPADAVGRPRSHDQPLESAAGDAPLTLRGAAAVTAAPVGGELRARLAVLLDVIDADGVPALVRVGVAHAEIATLRPFVTGNGLLARALARVLAVRSGLEPTGVAVLDAHPAAGVGAYRTALSAYASGTPTGVAAWLRYQAECVVVGAEEGAAVATAVLAGRL